MALAEKPSISSEGSQAVAAEPDETLPQAAENTISSGPAVRLAPGIMKWNPGHYVVFTSNATESTIANGLNEIKSLPFVKGIVVRAYWPQLEPAKDAYDFERLDHFVALAAAQKKRFFVLLSIRGFGLGDVAPKYLRTPYYQGGVYQFINQRDNFGENLRLWHAPVRYRLNLLIQALAKHYNGVPNFEGVIIAETAFGQPVETITEEQKAGYYTGLAQVDTAARKAFANTVVIQFVNYPVDRTPPLVANLLAQGVGFGSPDVYMNDPVHDEFIYPYADQAQGKVPIGMQVEHHSFVSTFPGGPFDPPPVRTIFQFARERLHSNYIFWQHDLRDPYRAWSKVRAMFNEPDFPDGPSGGLPGACPSKFVRCVRGAF